MCRDGDGNVAAGCVSCAQYTADQLRSGDLTQLPGSPLLYNDGASGREYVDPKTCFMVWLDGSLRNKRYQRDGSVCDPPGCTKVAATPCPPTPPPTPKPPSPPAPPVNAPPLTESGNYPIPEGCPPWFANATSRVGIGVDIDECGAGTVCRRANLNATQKSVPPFCEHSCYDDQGRYSLAHCRRECELLRACQEPKFVDYLDVPNSGEGGGIWMQIAHSDWGGVWGRCDKRTCASDPPIGGCPPVMENPVHNFLCHDKAVDRGGVTRARACMPGGTKCSETEYRTDQ